MSNGRPAPLTRDIAPLLHLGMTTNDVKTVLMEAEGWEEEPRNWSQRPRYYVTNFEEWPVRHKSIYNQLAPEVLDEVVFLDDMTIHYGWMTFNEYFCFYDKDGKLVTVWAGEIR